MKIKKIISVILCSVIAFVCIPFNASAAEDIPETEYVEGELLFEFTAPQVTTRSVSPQVDDYFVYSLDLGIESVEKVESYDAQPETSKLKSRTRAYVAEANEPEVYIAKISGDVLDTCKELEKINGVSYAEPNYIYHGDSFTLPAEVNNTSGVFFNYEKWYFSDIMNFPTAWQTYETNGSGVIVAVIDNGFNISSTDFPANLWDDGNGNHGWNTDKNTNDISPVKKSDGTLFSDSSHGSNVAGVIGMAANAANGIGGAYGAQLMLINAARASQDNTSGSTFTSAATASAINYAVNNGADVINMSLCASTYSSTIRNAVNNAYSQNVAIIAAAGNGYYDSATQSNHPYSTATAQFYPAAAANVIGVMASDKTDTSQLAYFSNYDPSGNYYDVAAPGVNIIGCTADVSGLTSFSGTSQACPLVASCAALYLSVYPDATVDELYDAIRNSPTTKVTSNKTEVTDSTYYFDLLKPLEMLEYGETKPEINANLETFVTIDNDRGYIYGLDEGYNDITDYVTIAEGTGTYSFVPTANGNGTGSVLNIYTNKNELYKSYTIIIFGDVDGDSYASGPDAVITDCIINNFGTYSDCIKFAADVDFNDSVTDDDTPIIFDNGLVKNTVFQTR